MITRLPLHYDFGNPDQTGLAFYGVPDIYTTVCNDTHTLGVAKHHAQTIHPTEKYYFCEFVANVLLGHMGMIILTSDVVKTVSASQLEAKNISQCKLWH